MHRNKKYLSEKELDLLLNGSSSEDEANNIPFSSGESESENETSEQEENIQSVQSQGDLENNIYSESEDGDENMDSDTGNVTSDFIWKYDPSWEPTTEEFDAAASGCQIEELTGKFSLFYNFYFYFKLETFLDNCEEHKFFEHFFSHEFIERIKEECNRQLSYLKENDRNFSRKYRNPLDVTNSELYTFFAMVLLMSRCKKLRLYEYWSVDPLISTPVFSQIMKRDRFFLLLKVVHFCDNKQPTNDDKLFKIRYPVDYLRNKFISSFTPYKSICIDESLVLFKGRLAFKQYIPSKRHRFGVKLFMMCDSKTKYCLDFIIYTGANTDLDDSPNREIGKSGQIVTTLIKPFINKNHALFLDNWYNSPSLAAVLYRQKTYVCGTIKKNRKHMPKFEAPLLKRGEMTFQCSGPILVMKWCDKREIHMITTMHDYQMASTNKKDRQTGKTIMKPLCIIDYNYNMGGVDQTDMLISSIEAARKSMKWYKKLFFHFLDLTIVNSHALYKDVTKKNVSIADFQLAVCRQIIEKFGTRDAPATLPRHRIGEHPLRLLGRHFIRKIPKPTGGLRQPVRRCNVCSRRNKRTDSTYQCEICNVGLCVAPCFELYHTKKRF